ncbi:GNAT family N-acetyltransferase [Roseibaca sp. Y0-43]|uniref:GNAT family N-acetyltransferase n=1 Tax=Roseibaca sp. Y0-43 TaxID=2816854 RepID=UPI001D0C1667
MTWYIRPAHGGDLGALQALARDAFAPYVAQMGRAPAPMQADLTAPVARGDVRVACAPGGPVLGFVQFGVLGGAMSLDTLAVCPAHGGQGIGRGLVAHVEALAQAQGLRAVTLYTNAAMTRNLRFYPALGYRQTGRRVQDGFDRVFFRKEMA